MTKDKIQRLEYVVQHDPQYYVVKYRFPFYRIENLKGDLAERYWFWNKDLAEGRCGWFNSIYSLGYINGIAAIVKALYS